MGTRKVDSERALLIEHVFESWDEYTVYYEEALKFTNNGRKSKGILGQVLKKYFEIHFKSALKAPRYYYPPNTDVIVLEVPSVGVKTRARGERRMKLLTDHQHVIGMSQMYFNDQIAMKMKILGVKVGRKRSK